MIDLDRCKYYQPGRFGVHEECNEPTHREEFEHQFGIISDTQWDWLKRFAKRTAN